MSSQLNTLIHTSSFVRLSVVHSHAHPPVPTHPHLSHLAPTLAHQVAVELGRQRDALTERLAEVTLAEETRVMREERT